MIKKPENEEYTDSFIEINDSHFYGESIIPDCPVANNGDYCVLHEKMGVN
jgi:hypothetical protein